MNIEEYQQKLAELEYKLTNPQELKNKNDLQAISEEYTKIKEIIEKTSEIEKISKSLNEYREMVDESDPEMRIMIFEEIQTLEKTLEDYTNRIKILEKPVDLNASKNAIIEIRAGTGGEEAALFASELLRMYGRFAESKSWKMELIHSAQTDNGGIKEAIANISGKNAYGSLKFESGVHRVQRVPATESSGRIHTSAASVVVLPEMTNVEVNIDPKDIRIDVYRASGPGGQSVNRTDSAVRITHLPTKTIVTCQDSKSQIKNREQAMSVLRSRLYDMEKSKQDLSVGSQRKEAIQTGDRSAKIRTYNFPQSRITDHRIKQSWYNIEEVMNGKLDEIIDAVQVKL